MLYHINVYMVHTAWCRKPTRDAWSVSKSSVGSWWPTPCARFAQRGSGNLAVPHFPPPVFTSIILMQGQFYQSKVTNSLHWEHHNQTSMIWIPFCGSPFQGRWKCRYEGSWRYGSRAEHGRSLASRWGRDKRGFHTGHNLTTFCHVLFYVCTRRHIL